MIEPRGHSVLDTPLSRSMTTRSGAARQLTSTPSLRGASRRSNPYFLAFFPRRDGLLRGACHRARIRATRWLAMTALSSRTNAYHILRRHRPRRRAIQYSETSVMDSQSCGVLDTRLRGYDGFVWRSAVRRICGLLAPPCGIPQGGAGTLLCSRWEIRSVNLTIFWRCDHPRFSFRTASERLPGNQPSMVLAEDVRSKGSGNADSQPNVRSSGESGQCRSSRSDSGCVPAHPASRRASASYRPLRAVWAVCAWALRGCARSPDPFSAQTAAHT